jgi:hypothetical protein
MTEEERAALAGLLALILRRRLTPIARWLGEHGPEPMALEMLKPLEKRLEETVSSAREAIENDPDLQDPERLLDPGLH